MTTINETRVFNLELLRSLVWWAMGEHERLDAKYAPLLGANWNQGLWGEKIKNGTCKTSYCIAGATVAISDAYDMVWRDESDPDEPSRQILGTDLCVPAGTDTDRDNPEVRSIEHAARDELGITMHEAEELFAGYNSLDRVVGIALEICSRRGQRLFG